MALIVRTFGPKPGQGPQLIQALQAVATRMIEEHGADAVVLCRQTDASERILWIETRPHDQALPQVPASVRPMLGEMPMLRPLEFLDGFYRSPMPACHVWNVEVRTPAGRPTETLRSLLRLARHAFHDRNVAGLSLYRAVDDPTVLALFLGLVPPVTPGQYFQGQTDRLLSADAEGQPLVWRALSVTWTMGRLPGQGRSSSSLYPPTAFWARWRAPEVPGASEPHPRSGAGLAGAR